ncbi:MAG TPA: fused MFS/spermidine synthase [Chthoniobacterales bacterium]|jgi:spermidine synthase|nr:fused MFS/spermidine synthase [Chthoniobacterales bacterium]
MVDRIRRDSIFPLVGLVFAIAITCLSAERVSAEVNSLSFETPYNHITIERAGAIVEMRSVWRSRLYRESAVDLNDPTHLVVPYTTWIAASAIFHPTPKHALMIGLGGGGFNQFFEQAFPTATLETVEIDPKVSELAQKYLAFKPSERDKVNVADGRMFLRHSKNVYDWIILDAFRGGFVPPHLKTLEFYKLAQAHMTSDALFVANVHTNSSLFASDIRTMRDVFPQLGIFEVPQTDNAILVAANFKSPSLEELSKNAARLGFAPAFRKNVDPAAAARAFRAAAVEPNKKAPLLTDDFAPTEFLDAVKTKRAAREN